MNNKLYTVVTPYATYKNCTLSVDRYCYADTLALSLWNPTDGPIATLTVCLDTEKDLATDESFVDTNNCLWAPKFIEDNKLGIPTGYYEPSGFCEYPLYKFNLNELT